MRKSIRIISAVIVLFMLGSMMLGGCGQSSTTTGTTATTAVAASATAPAATAKKEPIVLKMTAWGSPEEKAIYEGACKAYSEKTGGLVTVDLQIIPSDYDTKLTTMIAGNEAPDVAMMESATITFPLAEQGKLVNLKTFTDNDADVNMNTLVPNITYWSDKNTMIGLAPGPEMFVLFYNKDLFTQAGIAFPPSKYEQAWSWEQFVDVAKKMTIDQNGKNASETSFDPKVIKQFGISGMNGWWASWGNFVYANGGDFVTKDGKFGLSQPEATDALQKIADLINVHHVAPSAVQSKSLPGTDQALLTKKVAMVIDGQWSSLAVGNAGVNYGVGVLPKLKDSTTMVVCGMFSIFASSQHQNEAWGLIKTLIDPVSTMAMNKGGLWMPSALSYYTDPKLVDSWAAVGPNHPDGYKDAAIDMMANHSVTGPTFYVKNFNKIMDIVNPALDKVWLGEETADVAMKKIEVLAQEQVQGRRDQ